MNCARVWKYALCATLLCENVVKLSSRFWVLPRERDPSSGVQRHRVFLLLCFWSCCWRENLHNLRIFFRWRSRKRQIGGSAGLPVLPPHPPNSPHAGGQGRPPRGSLSLSLWAPSVRHTNIPTFSPSRPGERRGVPVPLHPALTSCCFDSRATRSPQLPAGSPSGCPPSSPASSSPVFAQPLLVVSAITEVRPPSVA